MNFLRLAIFQDFTRLKAGFPSKHPVLNSKEEIFDTLAWMKICPKNAAQLFTSQRTL